MGLSDWSAFESNRNEFGKGWQCIILERAWTMRLKTELIYSERSNGPWSICWLREKVCGKYTHLTWWNQLAECQEEEVGVGPNVFGNWGRLKTISLVSDVLTVSLLLINQSMCANSSKETGEFLRGQKNSCYQRILGWYYRMKHI